MRPLNSIISLAINIRIAILPLEMNGSVAPRRPRPSRMLGRGEPAPPAGAP